jgi:hypothetical protein
VAQEILGQARHGYKRKQASVDNCGRVSILLVVSCFGAAGCASSGVPVAPSDVIGVDPPKRGEQLLWTIEDASGAPLVNVVGLWVLDGRPSLEPENALRTVERGETNDRGELVLPGLPLGTKGYFSAWIHTSSGPECIDSGVYDGQAREVREGVYRLRVRDRWIRLFAVNREGQPVNAATVSLCLSDGGAPLPFPLKATGDLSGLIQVGPMPYGNFWADVTAPGMAPVRVCPTQFQEPLDEDSVFPVVLPPGRSIKGTLKTAGGVPLQAPWVKLTYESTRRHESCSWYLPVGHAGEFHAVVRTDAPWNIRAGANGHEEEALEFNAESDIAISLTPVTPR